MTDSELLEHIKSRLKAAEADQRKSAMLCVQMLIHSDRLITMDPHEVAINIGLTYSWGSTIRSYFKAHALLLEEGYKMVKEN